MLDYMLLKIFAGFSGNRNQIYVPTDSTIREIGEALLIDGVNPAEINLAMVRLWWEKYSKRPRFFYGENIVQRVITG